MGSRSIRFLWGHPAADAVWVTYAALLANLVFTLEGFSSPKNLLVLLIAVPIHGVVRCCAARDARYFDLLLVWGKTRMLPTSRACVLEGASYSPLEIDLPNLDGRRRVLPVAVVISFTRAGTAMTAAVRAARREAAQRRERPAAVRIPVHGAHRAEHRVHRERRLRECLSSPAPASRARTMRS